MSADTTIAAVITGEHEDLAEVTIHGIASNVETCTTKQGHDWATFWLRTSEAREAVLVRLYPQSYKQYSALIGLLAHETYGPLLDPVSLTVTGLVDCREPVPALIAKKITHVGLDLDALIGHIDTDPELVMSRIYAGLREHAGGAS